MDSTVFYSGAITELYYDVYLTSLYLASLCDKCLEYEWRRAVWNDGIV